MKKIVLSLSLVSILSSSLIAKESPMITGLDISGSATFKSNLIWRGKSWSSDTPAVIAAVTLKYKNAYIYVDEYSSAIKGLGVDIAVGYSKDINNYSYDIGYINYGWQDDETSSLKFDGWDEYYLNNSYKINNLKFGLNISQRRLTRSETTAEFKMNYNLNNSLSISTLAGTVFGDNPTRDFAELTLSKGCKITGGTWGFKLGYTKTDEDNSIADKSYAITHSFSF